MFWTRGMVGFCSGCAVLGIYLFKTAPPPLPEDDASAAQVTARQLFDLCAQENATVRRLYTGHIVGPGKRVGLAFDEAWQEPGVDAGPLPALFLRATARNLERRPPPLGLFLGSDAPISRENLFTGKQQSEFEQLRSDGKPRFFVTADTGLQTAMYPDLASAAPCVDCHNEHPESPKQDWLLGDVMGATTWTYPKERLSVAEALEVLAALRASFAESYQAFVDKSETFDHPPTVGETWPDPGYTIPSTQTFMAEFDALSSPRTLSALLKGDGDPGRVPQR